MTDAPMPHTISVVSGKGGAGKSVVAVNLAETLAASGARVALLDVDLGQSACPVLLNEAPAACVRAWAEGRGALEDALHRTASGLTLVQGSADPLAAPDAVFYDALDRVHAHLLGTHDAVIVDAPAGLDGPVRWALDRADLGLLVLVGEPTAIADAYRLARLVWEADPAFPLGAIVNFEDKEDEARSVHERFGAITDRFTGRAPTWLGWIPFAAQMRRAVRTQTPAVRQRGQMQTSFDALARSVRAALPLSESL
jgi:flagellar biosynthesis protein FlhG